MRGFAQFALNADEEFLRPAPLLRRTSHSGTLSKQVGKQVSDVAISDLWHLHCRECEESPGRGLQQGMMSGSGPLLPAVDGGQDAAPEDSALFELD